MTYAPEPGARKIESIFSAGFSSVCHGYCCWLCCASCKEECAEKVHRIEDEKKELMNKVADLQKELTTMQQELNEQREANSRAPTQTIKNHVEHLKNQLAMKDKQQQV